MATESMRDRILDAAELRARAGGYNGFSFRDVAGDVGVKSASVHYHFATKAALAEALSRRYTARAQAALDTPQSVADAARRIVALFRDALIKDDRMCLCGLLAAERDALPPDVAAETTTYFRMLRAYLADAPGADAAPRAPETVIAALEGAIILARSLDDVAVFETVAADILAGFADKGATP